MMNDEEKQLVVDLYDLIQIVDHAVDNGAIKGWENIFKTYDVRKRVFEYCNSKMPVQEYMNTVNKKHNGGE